MKPNDLLACAITKMQLRDFSRLPVIDGTKPNVNNLKGIISWRSIGFRLAFGCECQEVRHCMEPAQKIHEDTSLFEAISIVTKYGYVLVEDRNRTICGIVTASDLSNQFEKIAGPFLLVGEIEGHLRNLIHGEFTIAEMKGDQQITNDQEITGTADLTFGHYQRLLTNPEYWKRLALSALDRKEFGDCLESARAIRNDIMHFDPDGITLEEITTLRNLAGLLENLARTGVITGVQKK